MHPMPLGGLPLLSAVLISNKASIYREVCKIRPVLRNRTCSMMMMTCFILAAQVRSIPSQCRPNLVASGGDVVPWSHVLGFRNAEVVESSGAWRQLDPTCTLSSADYKARKLVESTRTFPFD